MVVGHGQNSPLLGSDELFRRDEPLDAAMRNKLLLGLSRRNYSKALREFAAAYGIEKSAVSGPGDGAAAACRFVAPRYEKEPEAAAVESDRRPPGGPAQKPRM